ncbi:hypothetical protein B0H16DRAFT_1310185 [Mycena metata]|uniref:Uncharacterized protein n=1 Tax=Mycena metata TaxID=1033252 RepID=A0AAD7NKQ6_9AGAR|nr:hypothetical protein B0H16DRAFT_1310185 [Mycena metata]
MRLQPATRFDLSPSNLVASTSRVWSTPATPGTPSRRRRREEEDENIDPVLWSPSKKLRTLYAHLGSTSAGSLLLSAPKIKSYESSILPPVIQHVPRIITAPDWSLATPGPSGEGWKARSQLENELAAVRQQLALAQKNVQIRDHMLEEANATMVFQNLGSKRMNEALHQQEEKAATDRAKLFKGRAQCLSSDEFFDAVKSVEEGRKAKAAGKESKKVERERKKERRAELEKEWQAMKTGHLAAVEAWSKDCADLLQNGTRKKDLPAKPKLGKKPQLPVVEEEEESDEEDMAEGADELAEANDV